MRLRSRLDTDRSLLAALAGAKLALQLAAIGQYGYFRDELYYLASTRHLDFGYVEHPPLSIAILALQRVLFGDSLLALRILPALAGAAKVVVTALLARRLGGGRLAMALAGLAALVAPEYLGTDHNYSMNAWDQLVWTLAAYGFAAVLQAPARKSWLALGVLLGLGLQNKISVLWLGAGILVGLLLTPRRAALRTRGPWVAAAIALCLFAPYLAWQVAHGWPLVEFVHSAMARKMVHAGLGQFFANQILVMNPATAPIWLAGLVFALFVPAGRRWRGLALVYLTVFAILVANGASKPSYLTPAYPFLLAPGALWLERPLRARRALRWGVFAVLVACGAGLAPFALPLLPPDTFIRYQRAVGVQPPAVEHHERVELPQHFADMFGWDEMAAKVARAYHALPPADRARCSIYGQNYGEAGAIDVLGRRLGLPHAISGHNSYWMWGPGDATGAVMIVLGGDRAEMETQFDSVQEVDVVRCERCMPYERDLGVYVCRGLHVPLRELWPRLKEFI